MHLRFELLTVRHDGCDEWNLVICGGLEEFEKLKTVEKRFKNNYFISKVFYYNTIIISTYIYIRYKRGHQIMMNLLMKRIILIQYKKMFYDEIKAVPDIVSS